MRTIGAIKHLILIISLFLASSCLRGFLLGRKGKACSDERADTSRFGRSEHKKWRRLCG